MNNPVKIACIGEVMIELIADETSNAIIGIGGDTYNTAVYLAKLKANEELSVSYVTALGTDSFSDRIFADIRRHNIDASHIERRTTALPGLYAIETDENGERSFSYWRAQSAAKTLFQSPCWVQVDHLLDFDVLYLSGISMAILPSETRQLIIDFIGEFRKKGGRLAFDSNYRPALWEDISTARDVTTQMWSNTDIALPSLDDEMALFGDKSETEVLNRLISTGVKFGALKRGSKGPVSIGDECEKLPALDPVKNVVDSTAAGDSFNAAFLSEAICGGSLMNALEKGHLIASKVIQNKGAIVALD
ncbi:MAG: sugar kinase [Rhizobiaceae bacterium]|nr:sugar kinase [Rhizobiaceae bacterium]